LTSESVTSISGISPKYGRIRKANREDLTPPVAAVRETARALGLVAVRKGRLTPTAAGVRTRQDPHALLQHIVGRLPLGTKDFDRHAGWVALAVAGSGEPAEHWREEIGELLLALGWRTNRDRYSPPPAQSPTVVVLEELAGAARAGWRVTGTDLGRGNRALGDPSALSHGRDFEESCVHATCRPVGDISPDIV